MDCKLHASREKYRLTHKDVAAFLIAEGVILLIAFVLFFTMRGFLYKWNILLFAALAIPFFALDIKTKLKTKKMKKIYDKHIAKEGSSKLFEKLVVLFRDGEGGSAVNLGEFDVIGQISVNTNYAFNPLHELKRCALKHKANGLIDVHNVDNKLEGIMIRFRRKDKCTA